MLLQYLLVLAIDTALQRWQGNKPTVMRDKLFPYRESLNVGIEARNGRRVSTASRGRRGRTRAAVYLVNPLTGEIYTYVWQ